MGQFVVFRLDDEEFGVAIGTVSEILKPPPTNPVPDLPDFIAGVVTVRGEVLPLVDMRKRFSLEAAPSKERAVIVRIGMEKVGLLVDEVREIRGFEGAEFMAPPSMFKGLKRDYLEGLGRKGERVVLILNIENILSTEERIMLEKAMGDIRG